MDDNNGWIVKLSWQDGTNDYIATPPDKFKFGTVILWADMAYRFETEGGALSEAASWEKMHSNILATVVIRGSSVW